jgi:hypothetical protein
LVPPARRAVTVAAATVVEPWQSSMVTPASLCGRTPVDEPPLDAPKPLLSPLELRPLLEKPLLVPLSSPAPLAPLETPLELPFGPKPPLPFDPPQLAAPTDTAAKPNSP